MRKKEEKIEEPKKKVEIPEYYVIRSGDTLEKVAKKFDITVDELVKLNNIPDPEYIFMGNQIKLK